MREPEPDCALCPRLVAFRAENQGSYPDWHNGPVTSFGSLGARLLIVGLAPGLRGANRTGRPFTGDYAGDLLYPTLVKFGFAAGSFGARADDGFCLEDCRVTNAVRCVPPANKPVAAEIAACRGFLVAEIAAMKNLRVILALGKIAHDSVLRTLGHRIALWPFAHGAVYSLPDDLLLADSYHCSRLNTNTGRLTTEMFEAVIVDIANLL
ncbi:MAG: uracil-DNA glycosylase [Alphaproteobacteria bacterium]|nr:uracil-DNA glycosylase [Alphaproteobacteria bacterium]